MDIDFSNNSFVEYYEMDSDPWMMDNKAAGTPSKKTHDPQFRP